MLYTPAPAKSVYDSVRLPLGNTLYVRVIKIRPSTTPDLSDPIACDFSILDVHRGTLIQHGEALKPSKDVTSTAPQPLARVQYQAVSYTWGDPPADHVIELNGTSFSVLRNLWAFLHQARANRVTGYLWIDAICIDQTTIAERNHQVGMMGDIYYSASNVIVWLGECGASNGSNLNDCVEAVMQIERKPGGELSDCQYMTAVDFANLSYWSRAWTVQEYHLARRKSIWYGELRFTPQTVERIGNHIQSGNGHFFPASTFWSTQECLHPTGGQRNAVKFETFYDLLRIFEHLKCADNRDLIFALLPLLTFDERDEIGINPDYSKSATRLFIDVLTICTRGSKSMDTTEWHLSFSALNHMLAPDLQDPAVQSAILDVRTDPRFCFPFVMGDVDHQCITISKAAIGLKGCTRCHQKPVVSLNAWPRSRAEIYSFSFEDWQVYVHALLASEDENDRNLGAKYCRNGFIKLDVDADNRKTFHADYFQPKTIVYVGKGGTGNRTRISSVIPNYVKLRWGKLLKDR